VASDWRSRCAPWQGGVRPARARRTLVPPAWPLAKPRRGARIRTNTGRGARGALPARRSAPHASPPAGGSGSCAGRPPWPRPRTAPASPSRSSRGRAAPSPARQARRAHRRSMASSRGPGGGLRSQRCHRDAPASTCLTCGRADTRQVGTVGTALARWVRIAPRWSKKRQPLRRAVAIHVACPGL